MEISNKGGPDASAYAPIPHGFRTHPPHLASYLPVSLTTRTTVGNVYNPYGTLRPPRSILRLHKRLLNAVELTILIRTRQYNFFNILWNYEAMIKAWQKPLIHASPILRQVKRVLNATWKLRRSSTFLLLGMVSYLNGNPSKYCIKDGGILFFLEFCTVKQKLYHSKFYNVTKILH